MSVDFVGFAARLWKKIDSFALNLERQFERRGYRSPARRDKPLRQKLSVVSPLYNVAPYLDQFLASLTSQSTGLKNVEIILIDDGSTDETGAVARKWARRFPKAIQYVYQENQGCAAARNAGIKLATGDWITFPDPDDFLSRNYFAVINSELRRKHLEPLLMISMKLIFFHEATGRRGNGHALRHRYVNPRTERSSWEIGDFIQLSAATACFDRQAIVRHGITFDSKIKPTFEDGHFVNRLLLAEPHRSVVFRSAATYYYRKRANLTSALDGSTTKPGWYTDQLRYGYLDLLEQANREYGHVPRFIQTTVLYDVFWRFRHLLGHEYRANFLSEDQKAEFVELLHQIFSYIEVETILEQNIGGLHEEHRVALLGMFKNTVKDPVVYLRQVDLRDRLIQVAHLTSTGQVVETFVAGRLVPHQFASRREVSFLGKSYYREDRFWIEASAPNDEIVFKVDGKRARLKVGSSRAGNSTSLRHANSQLKPKPADVATKNRRAVALRRYAKSKAAMSKFKSCWLLMDRDDVADDNAEHLYRYLMKTGRSDKAFFVLRPESPDWNRLSEEGFKLIAWQSNDHVAALVNAEFLISSHADEFIRWPFSADWLRDLVSCQYVFLQHGVILNDLSNWLNFKPIRLLVTSTEPEYRAITSFESNYLLTEKEVKLTGLPRHDALIRDLGTDTKIMIMPTWRRSLVGEPTGVGMGREKSTRLIDSDFFQRWKSVLHSERLRRLAVQHGKTILFCPHPNLAAYIEDFDLPDYIETRDPRRPPSLQDALRESSILVTDYSSIAFEAAYLKRPVLYYQFDRDSFYSDGHLFGTGYFDFERDGFGPVSAEETALLDELQDVLEGREPAEYSRRRIETFPFRDGSCCERVYQAITDLSESTIRPPVAQLAKVG